MDESPDISTGYLGRGTSCSWLRSESFCAREAHALPARRPRLGKFAAGEKASAEPDAGGSAAHRDGSLSGGGAVRLHLRRGKGTWGIGGLGFGRCPAGRAQVVSVLNKLMLEETATSLLARWEWPSGQESQDADLVCTNLPDMPGAHGNVSGGSFFCPEAAV